LAKARAAYSEAITVSSTGNLYAWYQLGRIDFLEGAFDAAIYKFEKQIEYFGDAVPNVHYMLGLTYAYKARQSHQENQWQKAEEEFSTYITIDPQSPWGRVDLSWVYFSQGKYGEMIPVLEEGLTYAPEHPWLHNMYGLAKMNTGDNESAKKHFEHSLEGARKLKAQEWGKAYPGNDPASWDEGLQTFIEALEKNFALVSKGSS
jgi:tetratricopeptide (TPR) repeat protein